MTRVKAVPFARAILFNSLPYLKIEHFLYLHAKKCSISRLNTKLSIQR